MGNRFWVGGTGAWPETSHWSTTSGGTPGASAPGQSDVAIIDSNSFFANNQQISIPSGSKCLTLDFKPNKAAAIRASSGNPLQIYANASFNSYANMTLAYLQFVGTGQGTITSTGMPRVAKLGINKTGTITMLSDLDVGSLGITAGILDTNEYDLLAYDLIVETAGSGIDATNSTITIRDGMDIVDGAVCNWTGSTIKTMPQSCVFNGGSQIYNNIDVVSYIQINGSNTFNDMKLPTNKTIKFEASSTQIINSLSANGTKGNLIYLRSTIEGQSFTLQSANTIFVERYSIKDAIAAGDFTAVKSYDLGNNTGWDIQSPGNEVIYRDSLFDNKYFVSGAIQTQAAPAGDSLAYDTMHLQVWHNGVTPPLGYNFYTADDEMFLTDTSEEYLHLDIIQNFVPGDPMLYYYDDILINKFYVQEIRQVGKQLFDVYAVSAIGLLSNSMHYGGIYTGTDIEDILAELLDGIAYEVDPLVATIKVYGWLPYATKRDNLQQLTLAHSISLKLKTDGTLLVSTHRAEPTGTLGNNRTSLMGSVEKINPVTAVQVSEHAFDEIANTISLCNDSFLTERLIIFPEPCHDLVITNGTIVSSSANHAIVQGSGTVTLTGQTYAHTLKRVTTGTVTGDSSDNILFVDNATLVTSLNSSKVVAKLFNAFSADEIVKTDILFGDERTGDTVNIVDPYSALVELAFARKMDITFGGFLKSQAEFVKGFTPAGVITGYQNSVVITESGNWTVPAGVTEIRAVLIGGGTGGSGGASGAAGEDGTRLPSTYNKQATQDDIDNGTFDYLFGYNGTGGAGGLAGVGGTGGLVLDTGAISVTPAQVMAIGIGAGGAGGTTGTAGTDGGNTTLDALSSVTGERIDRGYTDILSSNVYGISGSTGRSGKDGKGKTNYNISDNRYDGYTSGTTYWRPSGSTGYTAYYYLYYVGDPKSKKWCFGVGGLGGGGAWAANWNDGWALTHGGDGDADYNGGHGKAYGGDGGTGRTPQVGLNATVYGSGGHGGNGGGGGGGGGAYANFWDGTPSYEWRGAGGIGGTGSTGGNGKAGCVILYY